MGNFASGCKSRLSFPVDVGEWLETAIKRSQIALVPLSPEISVASNRLPGEFHSDPADRMIVASARHLNALLITEDRAILKYAAHDHVRAISASAA
ncbi:MAG: type II toxin-antitoxin system VapC family toxin [Asticcacaulis sp.]